MEDRSRNGAGLSVRVGAAADRPYIVALGAAAFARFGDYAPVMRGFLESPDVEVFVAWEDGNRVGFALLDRPPEVPGLADLVAIAVDSSRRRAGIGRALMTSVLSSCDARAERSLVILTVAEDNPAAIALFQSFDFAMVPGTLGRYAGGQSSRRMIRAH